MAKPESAGTRRRVAVAVEIELPYPHHAEVFAGVQRYALEHPAWRVEIDQHPMIGQRKRGNGSARYDGVIARVWPELRTRMKRLGVPLVNVQYHTHAEGMSGVYQDPVALGRTAAGHLIHRGFKRIAYMYDPGERLPTAVSDAFRERVLEEECEFCALPLEGGDITDLAYYTRVEKTLKRLIDSLKPPAAVCFFRPFNARLAIQLCQDRGLHVPQDISILTYQDLRAVTEIPPQISSIDDNYEAVGYEAAAMLDRMMNGQAESEVLYVPPRGIHARTTTDYYAVEDPLVAEALRYITEHLSEKVRAHDVAYELAVSVSTLQKRFAKAIGRGMGEETLRLRLSSVKVMLAEPELTLATIATRTGFASAVVLSHAFKRAFGVTPGAYRKLVTARD